MKLFMVSIKRVYKDSPEKNYTSTIPTFANDAATARGRWEPTLNKFSTDLYGDVITAIDEADWDAEIKRARARTDLVVINRCCDLSVIYPCVCTVALVCPNHGVIHYGTHD